MFTQRRCTAVILSKLINITAKTNPEEYTGIRSDFLLGHSFDSNISLADGCMKSKDQQNILGKFRRGDFNILVATSVVEEGLDVRKCNLVVRFDGMENYRQYAQSKGRARASNSKFMILVPKSDERETQIQLKVGLHFWSLQHYSEGLT